jgi:alpha-tubulin suppressor-like RCC1 family protein
MTTGSVRCWGENTYGQLGDGTNESREMQSATDVLTDVQAISVGGAFTCALTVTGGVRCWGNNYAGQLGDGTCDSRSTPPDTDVLADVQSIAVGGWSDLSEGHSCAVLGTGGITCWGDDQDGQLGDMPHGYQEGTPEYCNPGGDAKVVECRKNPTPVLGICRGE